MDHLQLLLAVAQQSGGTSAPSGPGGILGSPLLMIPLMFAVVYFMMIRPQQKKMKEHQKMLDELKKGDQVITRGGIIGKVSGMQDNLLTLEIQEKVRVQVPKSYVEGRWGTQPATASVKAETPAESKN